MTEGPKHNKTKSRTRPQVSNDKTNSRPRSRSVRRGLTKKRRKQATIDENHNRNRHSMAQLRNLLRIHDELASSPTPIAVLQRAATRITQNGYDGAMAWVYDADSGRLHAGSVTRGELFEQLKEMIPRWSYDCSKRENLCVQSLLSHRVLLGNGLRTLFRPHFDKDSAKILNEHFKVSSVVALPVWYNTKPYAVLVLWSTRELGNEDLVWIEHLSRIIESCTSRSMMEVEVERLEGFQKRADAGINLLFDSAVHPVLVVDQVDGRILRANAAAGVFFNCEPQQFDSLSILDLKIGEGD